MPAVAASAGRRFGEAEATRLPESPDEWLRFDIIIAGDVGTHAWSSDTWEIVERCVAERGAMLVVIAGPRSMPHAHRGETARKLLPVEYATSQDTNVASPDPVFSLRLTGEGKNSPIMRLADSAIESGQVWAGLPPLMWRHSVTGAKAGAEVLAFAEAEGRRPPPPGSTAEERLAALTQQRRSEAARALIVTARHGLGKVAMLNFDQTWRLRYGTGDVHHHRFWGNLLRWGAGENLRAGTPNVRLGTDKLTYESGQPVTILAKLTGEGFKPETNATVNAVIFGPDGKEAARRRLDYRAGSNGVYEAELSPQSLPEVGRYRVELAGDDVTRLLRGEATKVETHFTQLATMNPVELGDLSLDRELLGRVTALSGGSLHEPGEADALDGAFGAGSRTVRERMETTLWDNWILMLAAIGLMTTEWIVRRRSGVA
jgi:hypothetical protein